MIDFRTKKGFICDMDGVIYHGNRLLPGVREFIQWLQEEGKEYLFLTNNSSCTPRELRQKLERMGMEIPEERFYTSALATAAFLRDQAPGCSAYVIGEAGLYNALYERGISMNDTDPDYIVFGETRSYSYERIEKAVFLIQKGAKLIGTCPDLTGPTEAGIVPGNGALIAPIELATGMKAYFVGKPNPVMMRRAVGRLEVDPCDAMIIGDRMDTDILAGVEAEIDTALLFSGVTAPEDLKRFSYRPNYTFQGLFELVEKLADYEAGSGK